MSLSSGVAIVSIAMNIVFIWTLSLLLPNTIAASAYSEDAFDRVRCGMGKAEITAELGEPLRKVASTDIGGEPRETWFYTAPADGTGSYEVRALVFRESDELSNKYSYRYDD